MQVAISLGTRDLGEFMTALKDVFARNLRRIMREKGVMAKDLAETLGVSASMVTHWRNGDKFPESENIERIRNALRVRYTELFREDTDPSPDPDLDVDDVLKILAKAKGYELRPAGMHHKKKKN